MANALVGGASVSVTWIAPHERAAEAMREFLEGHLEWMQLKSYKGGPLKLLHFSISESPEYVQDDQAWMMWTEGKYPATTGRVVFHLYEIYESPDGLHHHWIEGADFLPTLGEICEAHKIEVRIHNQMKITQSLWE